jgi:putative ABC transport system substrate-binding protein
MRRRAFTIMMATAALPMPVRAQNMPVRATRIGVLSPFSRATSAVWHEAFLRRLKEHGWIEGTNLTIDFRFGDGRTDLLPRLAAELIDLKPDLLVTEVTEATAAAQAATHSIPVVMVAVGDPVAAGLVASLARPGANITGVSQNVVESAGKRLEMLKLMVPELTDVAVLWNPEEGNSTLNWREIQPSAARLGVRPVSLEVRTFEALNAVLQGGVDSRVRALFTVPGPLFVASLRPIAEFAVKHRLASIFHLPEYVRLGGLMAYGPDRGDQFRRAATYVDRILKGAKPADLPVEQPTTVELSVNLKTARAIGLTIPRLILAQAAEVIE